MPEPLEFQIAEKLVPPLQGINKAAGYHHDVELSAVKLNIDHDVEALLKEFAPRPFFAIEFEPDGFEFHPASQVIAVLPFNVHAVHNSDPTVDGDQLKIYYRLCADVEVALKPTVLGSLATDLRILNREFDKRSGQRVWAVLTAEVRGYRTYGEPNG